MGVPAEVEEVFRAEYARVVGGLTLFVGDRGVAEELAQEAFVRLCQHWEHVRGHDRPGAWVQRVAMNLAHSSYRRTRAERRALERSGSAAQSALEPSEPSPSSATREALLRLPEDERAVVILRFFGDLSVLATAEALRIPEGTVKTRSRRALASLRSMGLIAESEVPDAIQDTR